MHRSDLLMAVMKHPDDPLIVQMHSKIENVYRILIIMEIMERGEHKHFHELAKLIREALEK